MTAHEFSGSACGRALHDNMKQHTAIHVNIFLIPFISIDNDYCHCGITYRGPGFDVNYAASFVLQVKRDPMSVPVHRIVV